MSLLICEARLWYNAWNPYAITGLLTSNVVFFPGALYPLQLGTWDNLNWSKVYWGNKTCCQNQSFPSSSSSWGKRGHRFMTGFKCGMKIRISWMNEWGSECRVCVWIVIKSRWPMGQSDGNGERRRRRQGRGESNHHKTGFQSATPSYHQSAISCHAFLLIMPASWSFPGLVTFLKVSSQT